VRRRTRPTGALRGPNPAGLGGGLKVVAGGVLLHFSGDLGQGSNKRRTQLRLCPMQGQCRGCHGGEVAAAEAHPSALHPLTQLPRVGWGPLCTLVRSLTLTLTLCTLVRSLTLTLTLCTLVRSLTLTLTLCTLVRSFTAAIWAMSTSSGIATAQATCASSPGLKRLREEEGP
jgi:hypothetical protein